MQKNNIRNNIIRHTISGIKSNFFLGLSIKEKISNALYVPLKTVGDDYNNKTPNRIGIIFIKSKNKTALDKMYQKILDNKMFNTL